MRMWWKKRSAHYRAGFAMIMMLGLVVIAGIAQMLYLMTKV